MTTLEHDSTASLKKKKAAEAKAAAEKEAREARVIKVQKKAKVSDEDFGPKKSGRGAVAEAADDQKYMNKVYATLDEKDTKGPKQLSAMELESMTDAAREKHLVATQKAKEMYEEEKAREERKRFAFLNGEDEFSNMPVAQILKERPELITDFRPSVRFSEANGLAVYSVIYSHDSQMLVSTGHDRSLTILRPSGTIARKCKGMKGWTLQAAFAPDDSLVCCCAADEIYIWDPAFGTLKATLEAHHGMINGCDWSHSGKYIATCSNDLTCKLWNVTDVLKKGISKYKPPIGSHHSDEENPMMPAVYKFPDREEQGHTSSIVRVLFSPDDMLLASAAKDKKVILWNVERGLKHLELKGHQESVLGLSWNSDSTRLASCDHAGRVMVWSPRQDTPLHILDGHTDICYVALFLKEAKGGIGRLVSCGHDCRINVWNSQTGELMNTVKVAKQTWITGASIDKTNRFLATCTVDPKNSVVIWQR